MNMKRFRVDIARVYGKKEAVIVADANGGFVKWETAHDLLQGCKHALISLQNALEGGAIIDVTAELEDVISKAEHQS